MDAVFLKMWAYLASDLAHPTVWSVSAFSHPWVSNVVLFFGVWTPGTTAKDTQIQQQRWQQNSFQHLKRQRAPRKNWTIFHWPRNHFLECQTMNCIKKTKTYPIIFTLPMKLFFSIHWFQSQVGVMITWLLKCK